MMRMMRIQRMMAAALVAALAGASPAAAQVPGDVAGQIKLIENQPADLDRTVWKDRRREAARKLIQSKDRRAVAVLIKLAETETFDIIGEIAIDGLGALGDPAAIPALQKIAGDPARDRDQREAARKALAKLGSGAGATPAPAVPRPATPPVEPPPAAAASSAAGAEASLAPTGDAGAAAAGPLAAFTMPAVPDDALAASERLTFAAGTAQFGYDSARKRVDFDGDVSGRYEKRIERPTMAWGIAAGGHAVAGYIDPEGPELSRGLQVTLTADGEARFYTGQLYGIGRGAAGVQFNYVADVDDNPDNTIKDTRFTADLQIALGAGYGRVLDVGAAIRVRRLARTLEAARALGRPIDEGTARRLQLTWWALRGERGAYEALVRTVAILREAGVLLGEPDAGLSYEILNVLADSQLLVRPSGFDAQLLFGEGYLQRPDDPPANEEGRVEQLLAAVRYATQLDDDKLEAAGRGYARLRLFAPEGQPSPWAAGAIAQLRRFTYGAHGDPLGALDLTAELRLSDDDVDGAELGQRLSGQLGFTWWLGAASGIRLAASVAEDRGVWFVGAELTASYGLLDATFAR